MYMVTRYRIEQADKYLGANGFTPDIDECFEYRSEYEANDDAEEYGGDVVKFQRFSNIPY